MSIVLNENEWAERAMSDGKFVESPVETLNRIAKYYFGQNKNKREVKSLLSEYVAKCDPTAPSNLWAPVIERAVKYASKSSAITLNSIGITANELATISGLGGKQEQRLAFTLLCIAKYNNAVNADNSFWVSTPDREIMKMANISTSIKRQSKMFHDLREAGLLKFSKRVDSLSVQVLFAEEKGIPEMLITDYRNLGYQYMRRSGGSFYICEKCGLIEKQTNNEVGRPKKYCPECAKKVKYEQSMRSLRRYRDSLHLAQ